jgi:hypothetical protein
LFKLIFSRVSARLLPGQFLGGGDGALPGGVRPPGFDGRGRRLQRIGRTARDPVKLRRAIVLLMSARGCSVSALNVAAVVDDALHVVLQKRVRRAPDRAQWARVTRAAADSALGRRTDED